MAIRVGMIYLSDVAIIHLYSSVTNQ